MSGERKELLQKEFAVEKENTISTTTSSYQTSTLEPAEERLTQQQIHVLIIGAGIAGITCALHLSKCAGLRVTIVEARNRVGGRIHTLREKVPKTSEEGEEEVAIDLGASWIHGHLVNPLTPVVESMYRLSLSPHLEEEGDSHTFDSTSGRIISQELTDDIEIQVEEMIDAVAEEGAKLEKDISIREAIRSLGAAHLERMKKATNLADKEFEVLLETQFEAWEGYSGATLEELSTKHYLDYLDEQGGDRYMIDGYSRLLECLIADMDNKVTFKLEHEVNRIDTSMEGNEKKVTLYGTNLQTKQEFSITGDCAVVTLPIGVLKSKSVTFNPPLPAWKESSISKIGSGIINKVVLIFSKRFWDKDIMWITNTSPVVGWFLNLQFYSKKDTAVLVGFISPRKHEELEKLDDEELIQRTLHGLEAHYGKQIYDYFVKGIITRWQSDKYSKGAYSFCGVGCTPDDFDNLAAPMTENRVFFAGEATHRTHFGNADAAYESGKREAQRIIDFFHLQ